MPKTFIIDCPFCKAKVAAEQAGRVDRSYFDEEADEPFAEELLIGKCPGCYNLLAGHSLQTGFMGYGSEYDTWSDITRVYPRPPKAFYSPRIPASTRNSLEQADKCLQAGATDAACVMFGRALESICNDLLLTDEEKRAARESASKKYFTLAIGINRLHEKKSSMTGFWIGASSFGPSEM